MKQQVFDGKMEAGKIEDNLRLSGVLKGKKLVIIQCDGHDTESTYVRLKREMGEKLGAEVKIQITNIKLHVDGLVRDANENRDVDGILVQLPIKGADRGETEQILSTINPGKDIDGLNPKSEFVPAVVMAVETVLKKINLGRELPVAVVGSEGQVGKRLYGRLLELGYVVSGFEKGDDLMRLTDFGVVISSTGVQGVIRPEMVQEGFVGIDLGYPQAEISPEAAKKAGVITPVPGGVGPLTIVSLFENLAQTK